MSTSIRSRRNLRPFSPNDSSPYTPPPMKRSSIILPPPEFLQPCRFSTESSDVTDSDGSETTVPSSSCGELPRDPTYVNLQQLTRTYREMGLPSSPGYDTYELPSNHSYVNVFPTPPASPTSFPSSDSLLAPVSDSLSDSRLASTSGYSDNLVLPYPEPNHDNKPIPRRGHPSLDSCNSTVDKESRITEKHLRIADRGCSIYSQTPNTCYSPAMRAIKKIGKGLKRIRRSSKDGHRNIQTYVKCDYVFTRL